ncbi:D-alanyl-D-alanine carboxypeptidase [Proteiniclasticum sp. BAD-10]|uniref:D-alanyl-D-alanine carboxypeptidase n=1 Tax=Proteiniclasticum sediminis TaxID=2804028 RepID=A0A941CQT4_9CLOT|nr:D-alanyl-D-alanine carboxypeptidase [Proteiniclasticum sediminis]MBR0575658.1 D-alanyl-D-alanine carboxypeptidase [Proteiniclasticum sediminis]
MGKTFKKLSVLLLIMIFLFPNIVVKAAMPQINGASAVTFDLETGELIFTKNIDDKKYPASITKLLTALVFSDAYANKKTEYLKYPAEGKLMVPYAIYYNLKNIPVGEEISADDIMHALLLGSANDAAVVIALNVSKTMDEFMALMNAKAKELGMVNSHFVNPTGLHDPDHYTTAYDLTFLVKAAYADPWIREVSKKTDYVMKSKNQTLGNIISKNVLTGLEGNVLGKTGFTGEAGRCFASVFERDGRAIGSVILDSENDAGNVRVFNDTLLLVDDSYLEERVVKVAKSEEIGTIILPYKPYRFFGPTKEMEVPVIAGNTISYYSNDVNLSETKLDIAYDYPDVRTIKVGTVVGTAQLKERNLTKSVQLLSTIDVPGKILKTHLFSYIVLTLAAFLILLVLVLTFIGKRRRKLARKRRLEAGRRSRKYVDDHHRRKY